MCFTLKIDATGLILLAQFAKITCMLCLNLCIYVSSLFNKNVMKIDLTGKYALVGGATGGIGKAIALVLAECGAEIYLMARNKEKLQVTLQELSTDNGQSHGLIVTDFMDYDNHKLILQNFFANHHVDILINNTNGPAGGEIESKSESDYLQAFNLLFQNAVFTSNLVLNHMKKQGFGRIINVSSLTVKEPQDSLILSNTMRIALVSWCKSLANAVASDGITVNSIMTGYFATDRLYSLMEAQAKKQGAPLLNIEKARIESIPAKRLGDPKEYGYLAAFLASPFANYLTGASIPLDGGLSKAVF